jgi:hypothetical protein
MQSNHRADDRQQTQMDTDKQSVKTPIGREFNRAAKTDALEETAAMMAALTRDAATRLAEAAGPDSFARRDGRWQMANGRWQMADGRWQMADGKGA